MRDFAELNRLAKIASKRTYTYDVYSVCHKTWKKTKVNSTAMKIEDACVFRASFTTHPYRSIELEEILHEDM